MGNSKTETASSNENSSVMPKDSQIGPTKLDERSLQLRRLVLRALAAADKGHVGSALSLIEIFRVLYDHIARHDPARPTWDARDRVILSKGHGCLALYAALADHGYFSPDLLDTFCERHSPLGGHPEQRLDLGIEASTGALGHGLPIAVGIATAHQKRRTRVRVFVVVGDGELNEGSNWEAMLIASKYKLSNLTIIIDHNAQQLHGPLEKVLPLAPVRAKLEAFGADAIEVDGHDPAGLLEAFNRPRSAEVNPRVIICRTVKGKGLLAAEHNPTWHYKRTFGEKLIKDIAAEWSGTGSLTE
jgi:transketolase